MVTDEELHFLETYARFSYTGAGKIVDLGCWLGATTEALARGLRDNPSRNRFAQPIDSYDQFLWQEWMTPIAQGLGVPSAFREGDEFFNFAESALKESLPLVRLWRVDLAQEQIVREPVEFLMIDAMKSWPLANAISRSFLPKLIPGRSLVVQQDFGHYHQITATNHIFMWSLRDWLEPVHQIPASTSVVFFLTKRLTEPEVARIDPWRLPLEIIESAWRYSLSFANPTIAPAIRYCKLLFLLEQRRFDAAVAAAQELRHAGVALDGPAWNDTVAMLNALGRQSTLPLPDRASIGRVCQILGFPMQG
jgi:hypothetical protein